MCCKSPLGTVSFHEANPCSFCMQCPALAYFPWLQPSRSPGGRFSQMQQLVISAFFRLQELREQQSQQQQLLATCLTQTPGSMRISCAQPQSPPHLLSQSQQHPSQQAQPHARPSRPLPAGQYSADTQSPAAAATHGFGHPASASAACSMPQSSRRRHLPAASLPDGGVTPSSFGSADCQAALRGITAHPSVAVAGSPGLSEAAQQTAGEQTVLISLPVDLPKQFRELLSAHSSSTTRSSGEVSDQSQGSREVKLTSALSSYSPTTTRGCPAHCT